MVWDCRVIELVGSLKIRPQIVFGQILEFDTDQKVSLPFRHPIGRRRRRKCAGSDE
jgi:hypothetical protein